MSFDPTTLSPQIGRTAVVTGANAGLGFETALAFAKLGITTVMACRSEERAQKAMEKIRAQAPEATLEFSQLDLSDLDNVRAFAKRFREDHDQLDLLVLNAGIMVPPFSKTKDGFESQMGANYFGHFLLTSLLLDLMPDTNDSRVVALSSNAHRMGTKTIHFGDLHFDGKYSAIGAYAQSKLACLMFGNTLSKKLAEKNSKVVAASAHPGVSPTELARFLNPVVAGIFKYTIAPIITHAPPLAALPQLQAALDDDVKGGDYFGPTGFQQMKGAPGKVDQLPYAQDAAHQEKLWALSEELTGATFPFEKGSDDVDSSGAARA